jgi:signal transduction histidine kinase
MIKRPNLRKRILTGLIIYTCLLTVAVGLNGFIVNKKIETLVWETVLNLEIDYFYKDINSAPPSSIESTKLYWYDQNKGDLIPDEFNQLNNGIHDNVNYLDKTYVIRVIESNKNKQVLALDITDIERHENKMLLLTILLTIFAILIIAFITFKQMGKLFDPLLKIADQLKMISPEKDRIKIEVLNYEYYESSILTTALNDYLQKSEHYLNQEKVFFETASHELRTPISVISGAIEVILQHPDTTDRLQPHLERVSRITAEMEDLLAILLMLSRSKERLAQYSESIDLMNEIPQLIQYHQHLCYTKELNILNNIRTSFKLTAPLQLLRITIGNLLRNAIENSDKGVINRSLAKVNFDSSS